MATAVAADQISYEDLYARWERSHWSATAIDFAQDRVQWAERFSDFERRAAIWNYALFFWGEDAVADTLSPYIDAAPREEQKYFLATQQVDEARHAVFFKRFMKEVCGLGDGTVGGGLAAIESELTWGFRKVFDRLDEMADELRRDRSRPKLAAAVALYHVVVEATMAQPGQHYIEGYLTERDLLPGFCQGMHNVSQDEQRHIGFGVKLISELVAEDPDCVAAIAELLREVTPWTAAVLTPPGGDRRYTECFGFTLEEIGTAGVESLASKLRAAGIPLEELPGRPVVPLDMTPRQRAERGLALVDAGIIGERNGSVHPTPEHQALLFDTVRRSVNPDHGLARPTTLQWDFRDAETWHIRIDNGSTSAQAGSAAHPDLRFRCRYEDWVDIVAGRADPRRAMLTGRMLPRGNPRVLARMPQILGR
ncbi:MAG: ribonucleotide-diphosphate reductase subunit beta [Thermoleophilaceae bacterium]|nr:ribonucleotide-diphosphate reductase subunit beta [Thermoleophilaceae bacterium]